MPRLTTFGYEAEFSQNANAVVAELHALGLAGAPRLHGYHCDCDTCVFDGSWAYRGQTDSSCSGEIISDICDMGQRGVEWMKALETVAVDVDAEPGPNSGFHVHVGMADLGVTNRAEILWQFLRWEHILERIAGGRWSHQRDGQNRTVKTCLSYYFNECTRSTLTPGSILAWERGVFGSDDDHALDLKRRLVEEHACSDRHSNLNTANRRHPTWEFRLWNSTRVAWRMELFTGLSVALVDPSVVANLGELVPPTRLRLPATGIESVALACDDAGHSRTAELLTKQAEYLTLRAGSAPSVLTAL